MWHQNTLRQLTIDVSATAGLYRAENPAFGKNHHRNVHGLRTQELKKSSCADGYQRGTNYYKIWFSVLA